MDDGGVWVRVHPDFAGSGLEWAMSIESESDLAGLDADVVVAQQENGTLWMRCGDEPWQIVCSDGQVIDTGGHVEAVGGLKGEYNDYITHTFTESGTFSVLKPGFCEVFVQNGGNAGGTGGMYGTGYGSGGSVPRLVSEMYVLEDDYSIVVGKGGQSSGAGGQKSSALGLNLSANNLPNAGQGGSAPSANMSYRGKTYGSGGSCCHSLNHAGVNHQHPNTGNGGRGGIHRHGGGSDTGFERGSDGVVIISYLKPDVVARRKALIDKAVNEVFK